MLGPGQAASVTQRQRQWGSRGTRALSGSVTEQFDQPCWTLTSAPVYTSVTHAQAFVPGCLQMPLASSQLPIVVICKMLRETYRIIVLFSSFE